MNVERSEPRQLEQRTRQDASVRSQDEQIEPLRGDLGGELSQPRRFVDANAELEGGRLYGARRQALAAAGGTIRLRHDAGKLCARRHGAQTRHRERAGAEKEHVHVSAISFSSSLTAGRMFFARSM